MFRKIDHLCGPGDCLDLVEFISSQRGRGLSNPWKINLESFDQETERKQEGTFCGLTEVGLCADRICHAPVSVSGLFDLWPLSTPPSPNYLCTPSPFSPPTTTTLTLPSRPCHVLPSQRSVSENSLVAMDFSGRTGRVIDNPVEAQSAALEEGQTWRVRRRGVKLGLWDGWTWI